MTRDSQFGILWQQSPSGIYIPTGTSASLHQFTKESLLQIKDKATQIRALFSAASVRLSPMCGLARLMATACHLADKWMLNHKARGLDELQVTYFGRMADSILELKSVPSAGHYLRQLTKGNLDYLKRGTSRAKSALWELDLLSMLHQRGMAAALQEPPDIVVDLGGEQVGLACKKLFSENHVQNVLSEGVRQIERTPHWGIVALNVDECVPGDKVLVTQTGKQACDMLNDINLEFVRRHDHQLRHYLSSERIAAALVSSGTVADCRKDVTRFNYVRSHLIWHLPDMSLQQQRCMAAFGEKMK